jgi:ABC-type lipoprotein export system ATPase subunit
METGISSSVHDISLVLEPSSVTLFTGEPGCGKNLILRILGLLETPDSGDAFFGSIQLSKVSRERIMDLRDTACGYVFSPPFLLPDFTVMENIAMPLFKVFEMCPADAQTRTEMLMDFVQLTQFSSVNIKELSPGLQLRAGLARALGSLPPLVVIEEPDKIVQGREMDAFRTLLHRAAADFECAIAVSAGSEIPSMLGERRIECVRGRIVCDVMP